MFIELCGVSKAQSSVDYAMLEYCIREDLKMKKPRMMAVLDPIKLVIDNYPEGQVEYLDVANNLENEELGIRKVPFGRELYIEREDFMEPPAPGRRRSGPGRDFGAGAPQIAPSALICNRPPGAFDTRRRRPGKTSLSACPRR